jgi:hypothetical protein
VAADPVGWGLLPLFDEAARAACGGAPRGALLEGAPTAQALYDIVASPRPFGEALREALGLPLGAAGGPAAAAGPPSVALRRDAAAALVRLHDGQLTGLVSIPPGGYSAAHVPLELRRAYDVGATVEALDAGEGRPAGEPLLASVLPDGEATSPEMRAEFEQHVDALLAQAVGVPLPPNAVSQVQASSPYSATVATGGSGAAARAVAIRNVWCSFSYVLLGEYPF